MRAWRAGSPTTRPLASHRALRPPQFANFSAYAYAPAILVTPLGAISIIVSAILADYFLQERLHICGLMGCFLCTIGSFVLVSYAPEEQVVTSVEQIWEMATQPIFLGYCACVVLLVSLLVFWSAQKTTSGSSYGETQVLLYVSICSLIGSLSVVSCKASPFPLRGPLWSLAPSSAPS